MLEPGDEWEFIPGKNHPVILLHIAELDHSRDNRVSRVSRNYSSRIHSRYWMKPLLIGSWIQGFVRSASSPSKTCLSLSNSTSHFKAKGVKMRSCRVSLILTPRCWRVFIGLKFTAIHDFPPLEAHHPPTRSWLPFCSWLSSNQECPQNPRIPEKMQNYTITPKYQNNSWKWTTLCNHKAEWDFDRAILSSFLSPICNCQTLSVRWKITKIRQNSKLNLVALRIELRTISERCSLQMWTRYHNR